MELWHPLMLVPEGLPRGIAWIGLLLLTIVIGILAWKPSLKTRLTPRGIVDLELAGSEKRARRIIELWTRQGKKNDIRNHLWWDNAWAFCYSTTLALGCMGAGMVLGGAGSIWYNLLILLAWAQWLAGLLDLIENYALRRMVAGFKGDTWPRVAMWSAYPKFALVILGVLWLSVGTVTVLLFSAA